MTLATNVRKRGRIASVWLIFLGLLYLITAITMVGIAASPDASLTSTQQTILPLLIVLLVISVGALVALWFWRKAGLYVLALTSIGLTILIIALGVPVLMAIFPLTGTALVWSLLHPQWADYH
ncbi:MAG: hypothetical protein IH587_11275 [Anaerolineae bacterium]|nr:hypothetical protein [Anaerolineae bacterium]